MTAPAQAASPVAVTLPTIEATIERGRLRFFAEVIGETNPIYTDVESARSQGHRDLPVPPTFLFGLTIEAPDAFSWLTDLGIDLRRVLHGTQRFDYTVMAYAGDHLTLSPRLVDRYEKRGGAMEFLVVDTDVTREGELIATLSETIIVRHPEGEARA